jgi:hypothetical protein
MQENKIDDINNNEKPNRLYEASFASGTPLCCEPSGTEKKIPKRSKRLGIDIGEFMQGVFHKMEQPVLVRGSVFLSTLMAIGAMSKCIAVWAAPFYYY